MIKICSNEYIIVVIFYLSVGYCIGFSINNIISFFEDLYPETIIDNNKFIIDDNIESISDEDDDEDNNLDINDDGFEQKPLI